ncbi:MAG: radical SAM protein [Desulfobacteraceae bacterium]|nr:radical SAM protein [Desulfobacteraceae bacterium]
MEEQFHYVFGPVPSRRLGRSLGIDLIPYKTCSYDCIYCQLGRTTVTTIERKVYVPVVDVLDEVKRRLESGPRPDYITLSGSGEPTLHAEIGEVIQGIKAITEIPVAVLTNGSLLWMEDVRKALLNADLVVPSLDAGTPRAFKHMNRSHESIDFNQMVNGMIAFRGEYSGELWLEIFFVDGINDTDEEIAHIVNLAKRIKPNRIQLNTVTRPPAEETSQPLDKEKLERIARRFVPAAEVIADIAPELTDTEKGCMDDIMAMCQRRPCTLEDISQAFSLNPSDVVKYLHELQRQGLVETKKVEDRTYFVTNSNNKEVIK